MNMLRSQDTVDFSRTRHDNQEMPSLAPLLPALSAGVTTTRRKRGEQINGHGDSDGHWYRVISGVARQCVMQADGQRRIIDFLLAGDIFDPAWDRNQTLVEAAADGTTIAVYQRRSLERLAESDVRIGRELRDLTLATAWRFQRQILILGRRTALERVCAFLLDMEERSPGSQRDRITLPMSRYDIADYLALSVETVSRCLTNLRLHKAVKLLSSRDLQILDHDALEDGYGDDE
jgi:CRP-like cAMP-binding protein